LSLKQKDRCWQSSSNNKPVVMKNKCDDTKTITLLQQIGNLFVSFLLYLFSYSLVVLQRDW